MHALAEQETTTITPWQLVGRNEGLFCALGERKERGFVTYGMGREEQFIGRFILDGLASVHAIPDH